MNNVPTYGKRLLLDCTLRDGGYVNNWEFDARTVERVMDGLYDAGVRCIELGIMGRGGDPGKSTKFSDFEQIQRFLARRRPGCRYAVMLNQAEAREFVIPPRTQDTPDLIRIAFFKKERDAAMEKARELKAKGYEVFLQSMARFMYTDEELSALIDDVNKVGPAAFYLVDSFSTLYNADVRRLTDFVLERLSGSILFGFHAHNNIQMAYSNAMEFLSTKTDRPLIADGSIYGMGRGAGNVPVELLMEYLNKFHGGSYSVIDVLALFEEAIRPIFRRYYWGFSPEYLLTAQKDMNSVYSWYLTNHGVTELRELNAALDSIPVAVRYTLDRTAADEAIGALRAGKNGRKSEGTHGTAETRREEESRMVKKGKREAGNEVLDS